MIARRTMLALSLLAGAGILGSAPAQAGHDRTTVVYQLGHQQRDYCPPSRHRAAGHHHYKHYGKHWRGDRRHYRQRGWERSHYRGYRHHGEPRYRIRIEYRN